MFQHNFIWIIDDYSLSLQYYEKSRNENYRSMRSPCKFGTIVDNAMAEAPPTGNNTIIL